MNPILRVLPLASLLAAPVLAQGSLLLSVSQAEQTLSGSGGTNLRFLYPNEIAQLEFVPGGCATLSSEKWEPRTCFHTMAGDENGDTMYWNPAIFGQIDAILSVPNGTVPNQRTVFWSPAAGSPMGTGVSGLPGLRPGDVGRIVRNTAGDGRVEYFMRAEHVQSALGMPITPVLVDVDDVAMSPNYGIFFSLEADTVVNTTCGVTFVRDGDLLAIPPWAITWTPDMRVQSVIPGSVMVVYTEAQMDAFVAASGVTDRLGNCLTAIGDLKGLEIDWSSTGSTVIPGCTGAVLFVPNFLFTGETMTGGSILTTAGGGTIVAGPCGPLGTSCGFGPTLGSQIGLRPPTSSTGINSYVNGLDSARAFRFVTEARQHVFPNGNPAVIDIDSPGAITWMFVAFAPTGPNVVAPSFTFPNLGFPDHYNPTSIGTAATTPFGTYTSPVIPWPCKLIWQGITITSAGQIMLSTPTTTDVL